MEGKIIDLVEFAGPPFYLPEPGFHCGFFKIHLPAGIAWPGSPSSENWGVILSSIAKRRH
jgi:hypothetical protein